MESIESDAILAKRLLKFDPEPSVLKEKVITLLFTALRYGYSYLSSELLEEKEILENLTPFQPPLFSHVTIESKINTPICIWDRKLYFQKSWMMEVNCAQEIQRLLQSASLNSSLKPLQLIIGGPGTGKTYKAQELVKEISSYTTKIALVAPTGKAVHRLSSAFNEFPKMTLHALIQAHRQDFFPYDLIVIDECSMISTRMWWEIFKKTAKNTCLLLIGDPDQLPPIDNGGLFKDLSEVLPCLYLDEPKRCENLALLKLYQKIRLAESVDFSPFLEPQPPCLLSYLKQVFSFDFLQPPSPERFLEKLSTIGVLTCFRRTEKGAAALNQALAHYFHTKGWPIPIMIQKNDYSLNLTNGQLGVLLSSGQVLFKDSSSYRLLPKLILPAFDYAYCISVHKSQGSEYEKVFLILPETSAFLEKEIIYTALTRAKKELKIFGRLDILQEALARSSPRHAPLLIKLLNSKIPF